MNKNEWLLWFGLLFFAGFIISVIDDWDYKLIMAIGGIDFILFIACGVKFSHDSEKYYKG